ncbi:MAG TPA: histidine phosphatase family protein, partial [Gemmatimonadales bacterium]|nr:histidine phosphatase family protein [Gemmatimonadales bacterium]
LATAWSREGRLQGRRDEPLLRPAVADPALGARLAPLRDLAAWCSTLRRTRETAALFGREDAVPSPLLDELDFGPFEGRTREELLTATGGRWVSDPFATTLAPALAELEGRIWRFIEEARAGRGPALLFGHGVWIRLFATLATGRPRGLVNQMDLPTGGILEVEL